MAEGEGAPSLLRESSTDAKEPSQSSLQREASATYESPPSTPTAHAPETPTPKSRPKPPPAVPGGVVPVRRKPPPRVDELKRPDAKGNDYSGQASPQVQEEEEVEKPVEQDGKLHFRHMTTDFPAIFQQATLGVKHVNTMKEALSRLSKMEQEHAKKLEKLFSDDTKKIAKLMEGDGIVLFSGVWNEFMMVISDKFERTKQGAEQVSEEVVKPCTEFEKEANSNLKAIAAMVKQQERDLKKCTDSLAESRQEASKTLELMRVCNEKEKTETNMKKKAEWTAKHATVRLQAAEQTLLTEQKVAEVNKQSRIFENEIRNALDQLEDTEQKRLQQLKLALDTYLSIINDTDHAQLEHSAAALEIVREMNPAQSMQTFKFDWLIDFGDPPPPQEFTYDLPLTFDEITAGATLTKGLQMFVIEDSDSPSPVSASAHAMPLPVDSKSAATGLARSQSTMSMLKRQETKMDVTLAIQPETRMIYIAGGSDGTTPLNSVETFDLASGKWELVTTLSNKRTDLALAGSFDGKIYAIGGADDNIVLNLVERFDPVTNKWTKLNDMTTKRQCASAVVIDNKLFVIGGHDGVAPISSAEMYDPLLNKWKKLAEMSFKRQSGGAAVVDNKIYALGGNDGKERLSSLECYDPVTNKWRRLADMTSKRYGVGVAALDGKVYVAGGNDGTKRLSSVERYDPRANKWESIADMTTVRTAVGLVVMGGQLYAVGGFDGTNRLASFEHYDVSNNTWELCPYPLTSKRSAHGIAAI